MPIFIERDEYEFFLRSVKFCDKIDSYSLLLGLDRAEVDAYKSENELFNYVFAHKSSYGTLAESFMRYKISNMQSLYYDLSSKCRNSRNYTERIGAELGITIATGEVSNPPINHTPVLNIGLNADGYPVLKWKQGMFEDVEIWKDSGNGRGYQKLDRCNDSEYTDKTSVSPDKYEAWKYSIIYLFKDEMVGNWSDEQEVIVYRRQNT
jgi:hypothetical protein